MMDKKIYLVVIVIMLCTSLTSAIKTDGKKISLTVEQCNRISNIEDKSLCMQYTGEKPDLESPKQVSTLTNTKCNSITNTESKTLCLLRTQPYIHKTHSISICFKLKDSLARKLCEIRAK